jgi:ATP-dependent RNA helicase DDX54/DBP10
VLFFTTRAEEKSSALFYILNALIPDTQQTVVFAATRHHCEYLHELLRLRDITSCVIYGTMDQTARKINIAKFRNGKTRVLLVTDVAARGIGKRREMQNMKLTSFQRYSFA